MIDCIAIQDEIFHKGKTGFICKELQKSKTKTVSGWGRARLGTHFLNLISSWLSWMLRFMSDLTVTRAKISSLPWGMCLSALLNSKESFPMGSQLFQSIHGSLWPRESSELTMDNTYWLQAPFFFFLTQDPALLFVLLLLSIPIILQGQEGACWLFLQWCPEGQVSFGTTVCVWLPAGIRWETLITSFPPEKQGARGSLRSTDALQTLSTTAQV